MGTLLLGLIKHWIEVIFVRMGMQENELKKLFEEGKIASKKCVYLTLINGYCSAEHCDQAPVRKNKQILKSL